MSDYEAIYDAVRSRISGGNISDAVASVARDSFDLGYARQLLQQEISNVGYELSRPSTRMRPEVFIDSDQWCALYGKDLQHGVAGFGESPEAAMSDFDEAWHKNLASVSTDQGEG